jgi:hypothetical protein
MRFAHMFLVSIIKSHVATPYGGGSLAFKNFLFRVEFFDFRVSAYVVYSVRGAELLRISPAFVVAPY